MPNEATKRYDNISQTTHPMSEQMGTPTHG